jgi:hypothetical protein
MSGEDSEARHGERGKKNVRRHRLSPGQYSITMALCIREQKGLCWLCKKPGCEELHHSCHDPSCRDPSHWHGAHMHCNRSESGRHGRVDSVKVGEQEKIWVEPTSAEIEIGTTLWPWYGEWLFRHTEPGKILTKSNAIHSAAMDARRTLGYGSHQTLRGYLKEYTNRLSGTFIERSDPASAMKWIERAPRKEDLDEALDLQLRKTDRARFVRELSDSKS